MNFNRSKFTTNRAHSGSKSVAGAYAGDSGEVKYGLLEGIRDLSAKCIYQPGFLMNHR